jgi:glycosyltransferase involved in cell wall biosynthesis
MDATNHPKIIFALATGLTNGGVTTWALNLSKRLNEQGISSKLISHSTPSGQSTFNSLARDDIVRCEGRNAWEADLNALHSFLPTYSSLQRGIFIPNYSWGTWATVALVSLYSGCDTRVIAFVHSDEDHYYKLVTYYEPIIAAFIAVSDTIQKKLERLFPSRLQDISKLLYPVPVMSGSKKHDRYRPLTITYAGRIQQAQKRILDLTELTKLLATKSGFYTFRIVGDGTHLAQLTDFFKHNQYPNISCHFLGLIENEKVMDLWADSDVCMLFSEYEGMSISMIEGMGHGCVPVVTDVSGTREAVMHGKTGFIFAAGDVSAAAGFLQTLETNRSLLEEMSLSCISFIKGRRDFTRYDSDFMSVIQKAATKQSARWPAAKKIMPDRDQNNPKSLSIYRKARARAGGVMRAIKKHYRSVLVFQSQAPHHGVRNLD